jgi:hypothetical protein
VPVPLVVVCAVACGNNFPYDRYVTASSALYDRFSHIVGQGRRNTAGLTRQPWSLLARAGRISVCNTPSPE